MKNLFIKTALATFAGCMLTTLSASAKGPDPVAKQLNERLAANCKDSGGTWESAKTANGVGKCVFSKPVAEKRNVPKETTNEFGNVTERRNPDGSIERYWPNGELAYKEAADGGITKYNKKGEMTYQEDSDGNVTYNKKDDDRLENEKNRITGKDGKDKDTYSDRLIAEREDNVQKTKNRVKAAELTNQGLQVVGSTTVNMIGQAAQLDLQRADAKISDSFKAAKKATNAAITGSSVNMATNAVMAMVQNKRNAVHKKLKRELADIDFAAGDKDTGDGSLKSQILKMADGNVTKAKTIQRQMISEQSTAAATASQGTFASTILAVQQAGNVTAGSMAAAQQQKSINLAREGENLTTQIANQPAQMITMQGGNGTPDQNAATADGTQAASTSEDSITEDAPTAGLGGPSNPYADESLGNTPTPGAFQASKAGGSNMGGGGGVSAGGGSAPSAGDQGEQKAQYVANFEGRDRYESGGTMVKGGGGSKGGSAGGGDTGLDFNSLLAQFLPKAEGEDAAQNGILEYGGGGRSPASTAEAPSYLDKSADIFQRIHQTYQEKQGRGHVGI